MQGGQQRKRERKVEAEAGAWVLGHDNTIDNNIKLND
jgi:hypothetical protein